MKITLTPVFAALIFTGATHLSSAGETAPAKPPVAVVATSDAPFTLQGFFGKGEATEVSLRDPATGRSVWLKRGAKLDGWKLESADSATGKVVLSQGARKLTLRQAVEIPTVPAAEEEKPEDEAKEPEKEFNEQNFAVVKRMEELFKDPKNAALVKRLDKESEAALKDSHPEFFKESGRLDTKKPGAIATQAAAMKRLLALQDSPEAAAMKPSLNALFDGVQSSAMSLQNEADSPDYEKKLKEGMIRNADRLYLERQAAPTTPAPESK